jgi:protein-disulfide isomerase
VRSNKSNSSSLPTIIFLAVILAVVVYAVKHYSPEKFNKHLASINGSSAGRDELKDIVKEILEENPEFILNSLKSMQQKHEKEAAEKAKSTISDNKKELEEGKESPFAGKADSKKIVVYFFDSSCGYCKKSSNTLKQLLKDDKEVKLVFKEFPILGENSTKAAKAALAVYNIDKNKYIEFHNSIMTSAAVNEQVIYQIAQALGIDSEKLKAEMSKPEIAAQLEKNSKLGKEIGIQGTPAFIINGQLVPGAIELEQFKQMLAEEKKK